MRIEKTPGQTVFARSISGDGSLELRVTYGSLAAALRRAGSSRNQVQNTGASVVLILQHLFRDPWQPVGLEDAQLPPCAYGRDQGGYFC